MRFLIVRTDIRAVPTDQLAAAWADGEPVRDEQVAPEPRRQTVCAEDRDAAMVLARAFSAVGAVRAGRQRVKVVRLSEPSDRPFRPDRRVSGNRPSSLDRALSLDRTVNAGPAPRPERTANPVPRQRTEPPARFGRHHGVNSDTGTM
ncbi:hypothetical protein SAMN05444365_101269 [Micromonospora pattaloongensis]|uniref:Uncharacterized protein n=1 Tax=Micromonospora pattaloongensis TaxID=405436 RepID=A0A1H3G3I3_9ACTN|nr:hypothetical protein SAMN05444365_101269 [Micromonospora pattaloongensis]